MDNSTAIEPENRKNKLNWGKIINTILNSGFAMSIIALLVSLAALSGLAAIFGANPLDVIARLFEGALAGRQQFVFTLTQSTPLILASLAVYIPYRAGFFNIGGQGQLHIAALASVLVTVYVDAPPIVVIPLALIAGMVVAMLAVALPLFLKLKRGSNEVTLTIMMTFVLTHLTYALVTTVFQEPGAFFGTTRPVPHAFRLPIFPQALGMHAGIYIALIVSVLAYLILRNTVGGVHLKAAGLNPTASKTVGIKVNKMIIISVLVGAACAGLAGSIQVMGSSFRVAEGWALGWGFAGISVAFLGRNPLGIIPVAFILSTLQTGARFMQAVTGVPSAIISVMEGLPVIVFICLAAWQQVRLMKKPDVSEGDE